MNLDKIKILLDLAKIYSPTGMESKVAKYLYNFLKDYVDEVFIDDVGNVIAIKGKGNPVLWFHAHMDTIPGNHFVKIENNCVYGLGVADDKASLASMACAIAELENVPCKIVYTAVIDEEGDSLGTRNLIKQVIEGKLPKPDGVIIGEPTGIDKIVITYRGSLKIYVKIWTKGGHASTPIASLNAIEEVFKIYLELKEFLNSGNSFDTITLVPTLIKGGEVCNKIPSYAELTLDLRIPPNYKCIDVLTKLEQFRKNVKRLQDMKCEISWSRCVEPVSVSLNNSIIRALTRSIIKILGIKPIPARKWGTSDMNEIIQICQNVVAYGPGEHMTTHSEVECVKLEDYLKVIEVFKNVPYEFSKIHTTSK